MNFLKFNFRISGFKLLKTEKINRPKFNFKARDAQDQLSSLTVYRACCYEGNIEEITSQIIVPSNLEIQNSYY
jgi:hypothetical protein